MKKIISIVRKPIRGALLPWVGSRSVLEFSGFPEFVGTSTQLTDPPVFFADHALVRDSEDSKFEDYSTPKKPSKPVSYLAAATSKTTGTPFSPDSVVVAFPSPLARLGSPEHMTTPYHTSKDDSCLLRHTALRSRTDDGTLAGKIFQDLPIAFSPEGYINRFSPKSSSVQTVLVPILSLIRRKIFESFSDKCSSWPDEILGKTIGILCLKDNFFLSVSGSESNPLTPKLQSILNSVHEELIQDVDFQRLISRIRLSEITIMPSRSSTPPSCSGAGSRVTTDPKTPPRGIEGGVSKKVSNNAGDFYFHLLTEMWNSGHLNSHKEVINAKLSIIKKRLFLSENLRDTQRRLSKLFPGKNREISRDIEQFYIQKNEQNPFLAVFLDRQHCVENDLWETTIKELINYSQRIPEKRTRDSQFKYGLYVFPLFPNQDNPRMNHDSLQIRKPCERCSIVELGIEPFLLAINDGLITRDTLTGFKPTPSRKL